MTDTLTSLISKVQAQLLDDGTLFPASALNSILIRFENGQREIVPRNAVRKRIRGSQSKTRDQLHLHVCCDENCKESLERIVDSV